MSASDEREMLDACYWEGNCDEDEHCQHFDLGGFCCECGADNGS
jgi:hypothetical protein